MEMAFKVEFHYSKPADKALALIAPWYKECLESDLVKAHNELAKYCNPKYEMWNNEFSEKYPDVDTGDEGEGWRFYSQFIAERQLVYCDRLNKKKFSRLMTFGIGEENELIGVTNIPPFGEVEIYFTLQPK